MNGLIKNPKLTQVIVEAWQLTYGIKWLILKRALEILFLLFLLITAGFVKPAVINNMIVITLNFSSETQPSHKFFVKFIGILVAIRLWVPLFIVGVHRAIKLPIKLELIKLECKQVEINLFKLTFIYAFILDLASYYVVFLSGDLLFWAICRVLCQIIIIISLAPISLFAFPLVIIQKAAVIPALISSYKKMFAHLSLVIGSCLFLYIPTAIVTGVILIYGLYNAKASHYLLFVTELIISICLLPMIVTMGGILFRDLYGLKKNTNPQQA